jgi:hypothetical protein
MTVIAPLDRERLREEYRTARPFPFVAIDGFLDRDFASAVAGSYPSFEEARALGREFRAVNENRKVQIVDYERFPRPVQQLADALAAPAFMRELEQITGVSDLVWDRSFSGGGMHQTAKSGWLDVHVDFNYHPSLAMYRRLNILVFLNPDWDERWGGVLELWDADVKERQNAFTPVLNRCVIFETSETSFHGVTPVVCPEGAVRRSFAAYYYTREPPPKWNGRHHGTLFRARPDEHMKAYLLMPASRAKTAVMDGVASARSFVKSMLGRNDPSEPALAEPEAEAPAVPAVPPPREVEVEPAPKNTEREAVVFAAPPTSD